MASIVSVFITRAFRVGAVAFVRTVLTVSVRVAFTVSVTRRFWFMIRIVGASIIYLREYNRCDRWLRPRDHPHRSHNEYQRQCLRKFIICNAINI